MTLITILTIIFIHWVADFIFQAEEWATNKSKKLSALLEHTATYSFIWFFGAYFLFSFPCDISSIGYCVNLAKCFEFTIITFVFHTLTDYFTSKIVSRKFANKEYGSPIPNFGAFTVIGFDQVLHYIQLFGTYYLLTNHV